MESVCGPSFAGNKLLVLTNYKSPNLRIVGIDPDHPERDRWIDIIPEREHRIDNFVVAGRTVCVSYTKNLASQIEAFDLTGIWRATVPCPPNGTARLFRRGIEADTLFYGFSSFDQPPTIFSYDTRSCEQKIWARSQVALDSSSVEVEQVRYQSTDGTDIPMFLVARKKQLLSGPPPVFLTGYGGFGVSFTPKFNAYSTFLMEQGLLLAVPNLRGGGEFGGAWYHAGRRHNRQNAIDDFNTAAEWLVAKGYTQRQKIAIGGGSNGGLLVAAALTQRPDLFRAVLCVGPLLDMLRFHIFDSASEWTDEYGSSENREDFFFLLGYSPYHHTEKGALYPAVLLISGDADTRCNPMHARKMAARLQAASNSGHPILLDYKPTWGHVPVQPLNQRIDSLTDRLAFICHELGVTV